MAKSVELEQRIARLELLLRNVQEEHAVLKKRLMAVQAQIDHVAARKERL